MWRDPVTVSLPSRRGGAIEVDTTRYPLVLQRWCADPSTAELDEYFTIADEIADYAIATNSYYAVVVSGSLHLSSAGRRYLGRWIDNVPRARRRRTLGSYVVLSNHVVRGMLTALSWVSRNLADVFPVASEAEGIRLAQERIALGRS